uniref:ADP,ATP carrier protein n=1 Tax=Phaeomonas parva TaxID=124430 RepID=A0A6U4JKN7_9STRA|mmetsp:Transcript_44145/g.138696  ORF Transcript_44145/g.138696 Transcript_44145/m.138696 type:complete len:339 (+) Transcript_44145:103-1119(+)
MPPAAAALPPSPRGFVGAMAEGSETANPIEFSLIDSMPHEAKVLLSGGIAGSVAKTMTAPLSRVTIMFQVHGLVTTKPQRTAYAESFAGGLRKMVGREGFLSMWKGNATSVLHRFPYSAINFFLYEKFKRALGDESAWSRLAAGAAAGGIACTACYPLDLVRTRLTTQIPGAAFYDGIADCAYKITKYEGVLGLYRGLGATLAVQIPNLALSYSVYGTAKEAFLQRGLFVVKGSEGERKISAAGSCVSGAAAGIASSLLTFPLDVIRRRQQVVGLHSRVRDGVVSRSPLADLHHIFLSDGVSGLYRGILPEILKVIPVVSLTFVTYEGLRRFLKIDSR